MASVNIAGLDKAKILVRCMRRQGFKARDSCKQKSLV